MALLFAAVVFGISPFTKWYVEKNCKELTGRLIRIGDIDIDILSGRITTAEVVMYEPDDTTNFVAIGRFDMTIALGELMNGHIRSSMRVWCDPTYVSRRRVPGSTSTIL